MIRVASVRNEDRGHIFDRLGFRYSLVVSVLDLRSRAKAIAVKSNEYTTRRISKDGQFLAFQFSSVNHLDM